MTKTLFKREASPEPLNRDKIFMKYKESINKNLDIDRINELRLSVGWPKNRSDKKWKEVLSKSSFVYGVWDGKKLVGMGRILEDGKSAKGDCSLSNRELAILIK
jgi:hypothetical protein